MYSGYQVCKSDPNLFKYAYDQRGTPSAHVETSESGETGVQE